MSMTFAQAKTEFDKKYKDKLYLDKSFCTVDGYFTEHISIKNSKNQPNEEYYKWQFIYSVINSEIIPSRDYIGAEISFPKGNPKSAPIIIDSVIFSSPTWIDYYRKYRNNPRDVDSLQKVRELAIEVIEYKQNDKNIEQVFSSQIRAAIKEPDGIFIVGLYYDTGRLFIFKRTNDIISRFNNELNFPTSQRILERYQLEITDPYSSIPQLNGLLKMSTQSDSKDRGCMRIEDLDIVYSIQDDKIKNALNSILRTLDAVSLDNEEGYMLLVQLIALKIFDEKQRREHGGTLKFYINETEFVSDNLNSDEVQSFVRRMQNLYDSAKEYYNNVLDEEKIIWTSLKHIRVAKEIVSQFQDYSFVNSSDTNDLYQLIFYNFAFAFQKERRGQFLTPLPIIDFIVQIVNPQCGETVCDPCCGIADFLSKSYINADMKLDDCRLYGFDNDYNMTVLAKLNMLLNGDGNAIIKYVPDFGSINQKYTVDKKIVSLIPSMHANGHWDDWRDGTKLMKYDIILTNPPFGKNRSLDLSKPHEKEVAQLYELHSLYTELNPKFGLDKGVVFLENTVRLIKEGVGRFAIVLSNAIASNNTWAFVRKWLLDKVRVVALFDLPANVFAETGVNTTIVVGYKPTAKRLTQLKADDYSIFTRDIINVGYTKHTSNNITKFDKKYKLNTETFETQIDSDGKSILDEDFSSIINEFREWCLGQEMEVKKLFLR